ncbi:sugar phosphate isomerase/epimerase [Candidatus Obscuribacterales bacterium]|nr:sugar phosphate isomerase/epimerase [Candidatus Obscuribacterales bacterium]
MMRFCFDATMFGGDMGGAIELAAAKGLTAIEYRFGSFKVSASGAEVKGEERKYLERQSKLAADQNVEIACLASDYMHKPGDKTSYKKFHGMISKLLEVSTILNCGRISFFLEVGPDNAWKTKFEKEYETLHPLFEERGIKPLLRLSTPHEFRGVSLKRWRAIEPQDWRDLISGCPGLSLSFSPADYLWLGIDYLGALAAILPALEHIEAYDVEILRDLQRDSGMFGPLWWRYRRIGKGLVDWVQLIEALKLYGYEGAISAQFSDEFVGADQTSLENALDDAFSRLGFLIRR